MNKKLENLTDEELYKRKNVLQEKINAEYKIYEQAQSNLVRMRKTMSNIDNEIDIRTLKIDDPAALLETFPETKTKRELFHKYMKSLNLYDNGGYWPDTYQKVVKFMLYRSDDEHTKKVHDGIMTVLPYIRTGENGLKMFDIFEHTLSAHCTYYLGYDPEKNTWLITSHRNTRDQETEDLMKVLKYIQKYLYYEIDNPCKEK